MKPPVVALVFLLSAGCIERPPPTPSDEGMCKVDDECNVEAGEICVSGTCWGNPPSQPHAAILVPPSERSDLVLTEIALLDVPTDGQLSELRFAAPFELTGRVVLACEPDADTTECAPGRSIAAQIHVSRPSLIPGRPAVTATATSLAGLDAGQASFSMLLPPAQPGVSYQVTVIPSATADSERVAATPLALAPPMSMSLEPSALTGAVEWVLGDDADLLTVKGQVVDAVGDPVPGMRVFAIAEGVPMELAARSSSVGLTDDAGQFLLRIPQDVIDGGGIDLVTMPEEAGTAPTLRIREVQIPELGDGDEIPILDKVQMPSHGQIQPFTLPVIGIDSGGDQVAIAGAEVTLTAVLETSTLNTEASFTARAYTDENGNATLALIPGSAVANRLYMARVLPPVDAEHAALYDAPIEIGAGVGVAAGGVLAPVALERRVALTGTMYSADGAYATGTTVTASLSLGFRWSLAFAERSTVAPLPRPQTVVDQNGRFLLFLDPQLLGLAVSYDLEAQPSDPLLPHWTWPEITPTPAADVAAAAHTVDLGDLTLPAPAYARGTVLSSDGTAVAGATVRLYALAEDQAACFDSDWPGESQGSDCQVPPTYRGSFRSDADGAVILALPSRPPGP
ncbi:hypothetical protein [Haliangium sp.]|uniref:hypothetical protein n=1 Tax=Haliangium sp. TaxID=2663208 RepID=UPI003D0F5B4C